MNVGAQTETDCGLYFAWGETTGYTASQVGTGEGQKAFSWSDYKYGTSSSNLTKYNASDNKTHLDLEDDAAAVNMGGNWHMPTKEQCIELFKETKNGFVTNAGAFTQYAWNDTNGYSSPTETTANITWSTAGYFFFKNTYTSVTDAIAAEDYLFVPAAGGCGNGRVYDVGIYGDVWASALSSEFVKRAWNFGFNSDGADVNDGGRFCGQSVRGVVGQMDEITDEITPDEGGGVAPSNPYAYVDLGLTSGTKWAKMNVGASSETDAGLYFAWGETTGYTASQVGTDKNFSFDDYALTEDNGLTFTKYNATDGLTHLELVDDAAAANMGGDWHMPNRAQCLELFKETKNGFVTNAGAFTQCAWSDNDGYSSPTSTTATISGWDTAGYFFFKNTYTSVTDAITAEDYIFIPAAGFGVGGGVVGVGVGGSVCASALSSGNVKYAWNFGFGGGRSGVNGGSSRYLGQSVRGVVGQMDEITDETTSGPTTEPLS